MTIENTFTSMADHLRSEYGITDKLTTSQLKLGINGLHAHNYLADNLTVDNTMTTVNNQWYVLDKISIDEWNKLSGKTVTVAFDITWSGYQPTANVRNRIGVEYAVTHKDGSIDWVGAWLYPKESSGSMHVSTNTKLYSGEVASLDEGNFYNQTNSECTFKATNLKIVENSMGGVTRVNLLPNYEVRYLPQHNPANNFDCYVIYTDTSIKMEYGKKYEVIAETNGFFSNQHQPNVESNKCILWLTDDSVYTQLISDDNTSQGTFFTWWKPTGTYYLRVNAYHKSTTNTIYAYNIRIYEL